MTNEIDQIELQEIDNPNIDQNQNDEEPDPSEGPKIIPRKPCEYQNTCYR